MVSLDKSIAVAAPSERVFGYLGTVVRHPRWLPVTLSAFPERPGVQTAGARFHVTWETAGLRFESEAETVAFEWGRRFAWRQRRGDFASCDVVFEVWPRENGLTSVRARLDVDLPFVLPRFVTEDEVRRDLSQKLDRGLLNLKDLAEGRSGAARVASLRWVSVA